jgi:hypothetical protein
MPVALLADDLRPSLTPASRERLAEVLEAYERLRSEAAEAAKPAERLRSYVAERRQAAAQKAAHRATEHEQLVTALAAGGSMDMSVSEPVEPDYGLPAAEEALTRADSVHQAAILRANAVIAEGSPQSWRFWSRRPPSWRTPSCGPPSLSTAALKPASDQCSSSSSAVVTPDRPAMGRLRRKRAASSVRRGNKSHRHRRANGPRSLRLVWRRMRPTGSTDDGNHEAHV